MKKALVCLIVCIVTMPLAAINVMFEERLSVSNNIFFDYSNNNDLINKFSVTVADKTISKKTVFLWQLSSYAENYFSNGSESNYLSSLFLKYRWKFSSSVVDVSGRLFYDWYPSVSLSIDVDNQAYTHLIAMGELQYRYDFETSSCYMTYAFSKSHFPEYTLDASIHKLGVRYSHDFSIFTSLDVTASYFYTEYTERNKMDSSGNSTGESFYEHQFLIKAGVKHFFDPSFSALFTFFYESLNGNGNYYFYGPNEKVPVIDGDELLINDFYSYYIYGVKINFEKQLGVCKIFLGAEYSRKMYDGRLAFNESDMPMLGLYEESDIIGATFGLQFYLTRSTLFHFAARIFDVNSNNYKSDATLLYSSVAVQIWF